MAKSGVLINLAKRLHRLDVERRAVVAGIKAATGALMDLPAARARRRAKRAPRAARKPGPPKRPRGVKTKATKGRISPAARSRRAAKRK